MTSPEITSATAAQHAAARPDLSSWVTANAGSGKTSVLTNRVARVLLAGTPPARVLCLTYTKAAAAEMQNRLFQQLGKWAMLPDADLIKALAILGETNQDPTFLAQARRLFARALETPGGLKIQTIHAFCESLLRRFPLEAGLSPAFELLDDRTAQQLREQVLDAMAQSADADKLLHLATYTRQIPELLGPILYHQDHFAVPCDPDAVARHLQIPMGLCDADILAQAVQGFSDAEIDSLLAVLTHSKGVTERSNAQLLAAMRGKPAEIALDLLIKTFLTQNGVIKTRGFPGAETKKNAYAVDLITRLGERALAANDLRRRAKLLPRSIALHDFAYHFLGRYRHAKAARLWLDFDDLIRNTNALLQRSDMAAWVLFRLDGGIDHILIDEAQDTSPAQWQIFESLAGEILAGEGARDTLRTLFVVGDVKQSIYSFQGADPTAFFAVEASFQARLNARGTRLQQTELHHSFRSARPILQLVDQVLDSASTAMGGVVAHSTAFPDLPGRVDVWPFVAAPDKPVILPPFDLTPALARENPRLNLARDIARHIARLIADKTPLPGHGRPVRPGDFLILVRKRGDVFSGIMRALKTEGVPIAGVDRLILGQELAVRDLLAVLRFAAMPADDLSLATVLRSPLVGLDEGALYTLAHGRTGTLWGELQRRGAAPALLQDVLARADYDRPFDLLETILQDHGGRAALLARLGPECEEAVDELLNQALAYETKAIPTLGGFLEWMAKGSDEVKRQVDDASDQVRIMTIHGAKGLEAPIVILPDTDSHRGIPDKRILPAGDGVVIYGQSAELDPADVQDMAAKSSEKRRDESLRLLYVALTRAKQWLIVAGAGAAGRAENPCWHTLISSAIRAMPDVQTLPDGALSLQHNWHMQGVSGVSSAPPPRASLPDWAVTPAATPARPQTVHSPSDLGGAHALPGPDAQDTQAALAHGHAVHAVIEAVLARPRHEWPQAFERMHRDLPAATAEARAVLNSPEMIEIMRADFWVEQPFAANLPGLGPIAGRLDLLTVTPDKITVYDFKTNRTVAPTPQQTPEAILRQMGAYRAALAQIFPNHMIDIAVIWTANTQIMYLDAPLTAAAYARAVGDLSS